MTSVVVLTSHKSEAMSNLTRGSLFTRLNLAIKMLVILMQKPLKDFFAINLEWMEGCRRYSAIPDNAAALSACHLHIYCTLFAS